MFTPGPLSIPARLRTPSQYFVLCGVTELNRHIIRLTSVTYAIRAQKLLEQKGYRTYVRKLAKNLNAHGCGYGLEISGNPAEAVEILAAAGIRVVEVIRGGEVAR